MDVKIYDDFSKGENDTKSSQNLKDSELLVAQNVDLTDGGFSTRKGCSKLNDISYGYDVTWGDKWLVNNAVKILAVINNELCEINPNTGVKTVKKAISNSEIYPVISENRYYFGDGTNLYVWGDFDYSSQEGTTTILTDDIVFHTDNNFYRSKLDRGSIDLSAETYSNTTNWEDVTDVPGIISSVVRLVKPYNSSQKEKVNIEILSGCEVVGDIKINLDNNETTITLAQGDSVSTIITKIKAETFTGFTVASSGNILTFTATSDGVKENGFLDPQTTGVKATFTTIQEGKSDDCELSPIKKCTMFKLHPASLRIFAAGNPDNPSALYFSESANFEYFKFNSRVSPTTSEGSITGLASISEDILVSYINKWYHWRGITPLEDAIWKPLSLPYGCIAHDSIILTPYSLTYLSEEGIYTTSASIISQDIVMLQGEDIIKNRTAERKENTIKSITHPKKVKAIFYDNYYMLAYCDDGTGINNKILVYNWTTGGFTTYTGWSVYSWIKKDNGELLFTTKNYILKTNSGENDIDTTTGNEKAIELKIVSKFTTLDNPINKKDCRFLFLLFKQHDKVDSFVNIILKADYKTKTLNSIDLSESLVWGRKWGKKWGYNELITLSAEIFEIAYSFQITIENSRLSDPITCYGFGFAYNTLPINNISITDTEVLLK